MIYVELIHNLAALVALSVLSFFIDTRWPGSKKTGATFQGMLFGIGSVLSMLSPVDFTDGIIFDSRSVALSVVSLYFGPFAAFPAGIIAVIGRLMIGGAGWLSGTITIVLAVGIGLIFFNRRRLVLEPPSLSFLYLFGLLAHAIILVGVYIGLPDDRAMATIRIVAFPMMLTYPLATVLIGKILSTLVRARVDLFTVTQGKTFFQSLFRDHAAIKLLFDANTGQILEANEAALRFYGWTQEEMKSMTIHQVNTMTPDQIGRAMRDAREQKRSQFTFKHRLKDGSVRDVDVFSSPIHIDGRDYLYSIIHDVTDRIRAEEQLHLQISALNSASNAIVITDTDGGILWANRAFTNVTGFDMNEAVGRNPRDLVKSGVQPTRFYSVMWETILRGDVWKGELVNKRKDGSQYYEEMTITPVLGKTGEVTHFIAIKQDITDRKASEKLLMHNYEELKKTNAELDRFVYSTSHDLRAPLLSVLGLIDLSREVVERNHEALSYLDMMRDGIKRADDTIKQILVYSRNSRLKPQIDTLDVKEIVEHHIQDIRHMKEAEEVRFDLVFPTDTLIHSDAMRLRTILQNLITNAVKYQRPEEHEKWVRISLASVGSESVITVEDNGEGIPEDRLDTVFEMFQRNSNLSSGSGLGLYMVREMVTRLGGTVTVTSTVGQGSRFVVTLPHLQLPTE
jgi:PAS domain S-box-containing protein